jgi:hypothetical protein
MINIGTYSKKRTDFSRYTAPFFPRTQDHGAQSSCGEDAVYMLTGKRFTKKQREKFKRVLKPKQMVSVLRERGYTVIPLSVCGVSNHSSFANKIFNSHVLLFCQLINMETASWSIVYKERYCHNCRWEVASPLEFINRPIIHSYIVWHKKWEQPSNRLSICDMSGYKIAW